MSYEHPSYLADKSIELWCDICDRAKVCSDDHSTGSYFAREGHKWNFGTGILEDAYTTIVWAICNQCLKDK